MVAAEVPKLNLSKYVDEVASSLVESKIKLAELPAVVEFCSIMHQTYGGFSASLLPELLKAASAPGPPCVKGVATEPDAERTARLIRKRSLLRTDKLPRGD